MEQENYYDKIPEEFKRDIAFNVVVSVRDAISIAKKRSIPATYEQALKLTHDLDENLYNFCSAQLTKKNENDTVKLFKERAEAESLVQGNKIKLEVMSPQLSIKAAELLSHHLANYQRSVILYHLDSNIVNQYTNENLHNIFSSFE